MKKHVYEACVNVINAATDAAHDTVCMFEADVAERAECAERVRVSREYIDVALSMLEHALKHDPQIDGPRLVRFTALDVTHDPEAMARIASMPMPTL